jgi:tetratricopeptide (TPR) repeat protein
VRRSRVLAVAAALAACGPSARGAAPIPVAEPLPVPAQPDAALDLRNEQDLTTVRREYDLLAPDSAERATERGRLAAEYRRRIARDLAADDRAAAYFAFRELLALWSPAELAGDHAALAASLGAFVPDIERLRAHFARRGGDVEVATAVAALIALEPERRAGHEEELDAIFGYADDLTVARYGEGAQRRRPIEILEQVVQVLPTPYVVGRLTALYQQRAAAMSALIRRGGPDLRLLQADGDGDGVVRTTLHIIRIHARAGRLREAAAAIQPIRGLGDDERARTTLETALSPAATAGTWLDLSLLLIDTSLRRPDVDAAIAVAEEGMRRFPADPRLALLAALLAADGGRGGDAGGRGHRNNHLPLAIHYAERALLLAPDDRDVADHLAGFYDLQLRLTALGERPNAARALLVKLEQFHARARERWPDRPLEHDLVDVYATMGRGLLGQGQIADARRFLERSIAGRPTVDALECLGTLHLKQDRFGLAAAQFARAVALPGGDSTDRMTRARMRRLLGEAHWGADDRGRARAEWQSAMREWHAIDSEFALPRQHESEMRIERGKILWALDNRDEALAELDAAITADPENASTHADIVSFLIVRGEYAEAVDAYHRALGSSQIGPDHKVYMSLWIVAEARRAVRPDDPAALDYLAQRPGTEWYDELARLALGRVDGQTLERRATTRARRAELLYYRAVLTMADRRPEAVRLLRGVIASGMLLFFEYDMAKYLLAHDPAEPRAASGDRSAPPAP